MKINEDNRCIVIADCHGQPHLLKNALKDCGFEKEIDRLVFAGDILDIGNQAMECIRILKDENAELLWGNHDLAVVINKKIWPQNMADYEAEAKIISLKNQFKVATSHLGVLITHAGVSQDYYNERIGPFLSEEQSSLKNQIEEIVNFLNTRRLEELWVDNGPLWYRPNALYNPPLLGITQVIGHTPPTWIKNDIKNLYIVDPFCKDNFNKKRFRYAIIENELEVKIFDSNEN